MKILILDAMQGSDAPSALISPSLADTLDTPDRELTAASPLIVTLSAEHAIDAVGIGNTDATTITITGVLPRLSITTIAIPTAASPELRNGLYLMPSPIRASTLQISHDGTYLGRLAVGTARYLGCSPSREPGFWTTSKPRISVSGQVITAAGSVGGRQIGLQIKYKITEEIFSDLQLAWSTIAQGYPYFVMFDAAEQRRMPWARMYAFAGNDRGKAFVLQSSANRFLYSKRLTLKEAF